MRITHKINDFLFELFPEADDDNEKLLEVVKRYYTMGPFDPTVQKDDNYIHVDIDVERIEEDSSRYEKLTSLADRGQFEEAKVLAEELIEGAPTVSEYHRVYGQILSEMGNQEEAINALIDALKWNPKNEHALLMTGNIFAKYRDDTETAMKYYEKVLELKPNDYLALNNIGVQLLEAGKTPEASTYINEAHKLNPDYPNTLFALAMLANRENKFQQAFDYTIKAIKKNHKRDDLYSHSVKSALQIAKELLKEIDARSAVQEFIDELTTKTDTDIKMQADESISTAATIQYAEVHNHDYHLILYKPGSPAVDHLILHELTHLELAHEARQEGKQELFISRQTHKSTFLLNFKRDKEKLMKDGLSEDQAQSFLESIHQGLNSQIFNAPIDLFIEDRIYKRFKELRPLQFLSLFTILQQGVQANTKPDIIKVTPSKVLSSSIIYNLVSALHFKEFYGVDLINDFNPKGSEKRKANNFYEEFNKYRGDRQPGEEYDLIQFWAEDLDLDRYFELVSEQDYYEKTPESVLNDIEKDPYSLQEEDPSRERKMKQFLEEHGGEDINMAVAMYMVDALEYFSSMSKEDVKKIAFEIAHLGMSGINPNKKEGYKIPSIPSSNFSGYKTLAYYYVSWASAIPEMLPQLQMPFDKEYDLAKQLHGRF